MGDSSHGANLRSIYAPDISRQKIKPFSKSKRGGSWGEKDEQSTITQMHCSIVALEKALAEARTPYILKLNATMSTWSLTANGTLVLNGHYNEARALFVKDSHLFYDTCLQAIKDSVVEPLTTEGYKLAKYLEGVIDAKITKHEQEVKKGIERKLRKVGQFLDYTSVP